MSPDLTTLLERSFEGEPLQPSPSEDLVRGRRALRRHRARVGIAGVGVVAASGLVATVVPALFASSSTSPSVADGGLDDAALARACVSTDNVASWVQGRGMSEERLREAMGTPTVMTRAETGDEVLATVRSEDGRFWGECFVPYGDRPTYKRAISVFRTGVTFPSTVVGDVRVYQAQDEADPRLWGSDGANAPTLSVPCPVEEREDSAAYREAWADCDEFTVTWVDRRPPEVAGVEVRNPDGTVGRADVRDGYVSYAYSAPMTPAVADLLRAGDTELTDDVTFLDAEDRVLARGAATEAQSDPDRWPASAAQGTPSIANYPSLAWWLAADS